MIDQVGAVIRKGKLQQLLGNAPWIQPTMYPRAHDELVTDFNYGPPTGHEQFPQTLFSRSGNVIHPQLQLQGLRPRLMWVEYCVGGAHDIRH